MNKLISLICWIAGSILVLLLFPFSFLIWLLVLPFDSERAVIHRILILQSLIFRFLIPVKSFSLEGREKAIKDTTYVVISNHQSILDILYLNNLRYSYKWISKIEVSGVPFLGWYLRMADYIIIERGNEESKIAMLERSLSCLKNNTSIMIFPEGTRSRDGEIGFFKRGAFQLAIEAGVPLLPIVIDGTGGILPKHGFILGIGHDVKLRVLDPVHPGQFGTGNPDELALRISELMKGTLAEMRKK